MVVVDHDTRRLVWAAPGRNSATVREFFDLLGPDRCAQITHVSADGAEFIAAIVEEDLPRCGAGRGPAPRREVGHRGHRRGPPHGLERRSCDGPQRTETRPRQATGPTHLRARATNARRR